MQLTTRFTDRFGLAHPIALAPMASVSGGALAAAISDAGGLGLIGGGYAQDPSWLDREWDQANGSRVGCGFITWSLARNPSLLEAALAHDPAAIMLSFGDPGPFIDVVRRRGIPLICQVQTLRHVQRALELGADVLVAQGTEAGGHGAHRATLPFVPAVVDLVRRRRSETLVLAAGGIADGRGLAAALALGADGVLLGTRFWASQEALVSRVAQHRAVSADGDHTIRTAVYDIVRGLDWPPPYTLRVLQNSFVNRWHDHADLLGDDLAERQRYATAVSHQDFDTANVIVGEAVDLIDDVPPAGELVRRISAQAIATLARLCPGGTQVVENSSLDNSPTDKADARSSPDGHHPTAHRRADHG